ncbi:MAG: M56 family metallopeptidase [Vicinamibacteria bacterium]
MNALVITLVVKASLLIAAVGTADMLMRGRSSAASRHLMWTLALGGVLALPLLSMVVPAWSIPIHVASTTNLAQTPEPAANVTTSRAKREASSDAPLPTTFAPALIEPASGSLATVAPQAVTPAAFALGLYLAGVTLLGLQLLAGRWSLRKLVGRSTEVTGAEWNELLRECESDMGVSRPVRLLRSVEHNMPMAFGTLTPTIVIPAIADTWSEERRKAVLLHELAHIARRDCLTQMFAALVCGAYWMHPGVWWMARRLRVERELACDDRVLKAGAVARDYAAHLLELAYSLGGYRSPALVVSMARSSQIEGRMMAIMDAARNRVSPPQRAYAVGVLAMALIVMPLAAAEAVVVRAEPELHASAESQVPEAPAPASPARAAEVAAPVVAYEQAASRPAPPAPPAPLAPLAAWEERARDIQLPGTWEVRRSDNDAQKVYLQLSDRRNSQHGFMIATSELEGASTALLTAREGSAKFQIRRDAGTMMFDGVFRSGVGAGTYDFTPDTAFPGEMVKRGFDSPNSTEQYQLARGNIGFAYLDELNRQKYDRPTLAELVRAADHGVGLDYLRDMGGEGYKLGQIAQLIRTRDHGVTLTYIHALAGEGFKNLPIEGLVRARDHGVSPEFMGTMRAFGFANLPLEGLIRARDHGISAEYLRGMAEAGFQSLPLEQLIRARDHGVTTEFIKGMRQSGYGAASLEDLMRARDHGVTAEYAREMTSIGPERPSLEELSNARDRGVGAEFAKAWRDLGYPPVLADLMRARDHGVSAEYISELKAAGYDRVSVEDIIRLRDRGISASFVRGQNAGSTSRLTVEQLVRRRDGRR